MDEEDLSGAITSSSNRWWGPLLWAFFHTLGEYSDRRDVIQVWLNLFKLTVEILPCLKCRYHLRDYLKSHIFLKPMNVSKTKGIQFKEVIRKDIWLLHSEVNRRLEKKNIPFEELSDLYAKETRSAGIEAARGYLEAVRLSWHPLVLKSIQPSVYRRWFATAHLLVSLLAGGPS